MNLCEFAVSIEGTIKLEEFDGGGASDSLS
jgi:hypothetical protein